LALPAAVGRAAGRVALRADLNGTDGTSVSLGQQHRCSIGAAARAAGRLVL